MRGHAAAKPSVDEFIASRERMNRASVEFLKIDVETALTFLQIARQTSDEARKHRNLSAARKAYETVLSFSKKTELGTEDQRIVMRGLRQLKLELQALGEAV